MIDIRNFIIELEGDALIDNERRADLGAMAVKVAATATNVIAHEVIETCIYDVLAYIAHFCARVGLDPDVVFEDALRSHQGDFEDGPEAVKLIDGSQADWAELEVIC